MSVICPICKNIYSDDYLFYTCPMERCNDEPGELIEVDDAIAPIVVEFIKKGWEIESVKFGNPINQIKHPSYIRFSAFLVGDNMFTEDELRAELADLPDSWDFAVKDGHPILRMGAYYGNDIKRTKYFMNAWLDLTKFVKNVAELYY